MSRKSKAAEFVDEEYSLAVTGRNVEVTEAMKTYAVEKVSKIEKYGLRIVDVAITMDIQKLVHKIDIKVKVDHILIKSHADSESMYASIDMAVDKLQTQIRKYHARIRDHHHKGVHVIDMNVNVIRPVKDVLDEYDIPDLDQYKAHEIVKQEKMALKTLTNDEALMKMELSGDAFLVFKCEEDMKLKVIYRRNDGNYGIIEPEA